MNLDSELTVRGLVVHAVDVPMDRPLKTGGGEVGSAAMRGSGYPGMWQLSNVTRWMNRDASSFGRREALAAPKRRERRGSPEYIGGLSSPQPPPLGATERIASDGLPRQLEGV
jgi:hypothetical protein